MHPNILWQKLKWPPELPFPGPRPVNTSSLTTPWPAVERALNESCWFWSVKHPKLEPGDHASRCLATASSRGLISSEPTEDLFKKAQFAGASFAAYVWPTFLMSGKTLQANNSLLKRRAPEIFLCVRSSEKAFLSAGICLWRLQPKYHKQNLKMTWIRNWFLKQIMSLSWQSSNEFSSLSFSNLVIH